MNYANFLKKKFIKCWVIVERMLVACNQTIIDAQTDYDYTAFRLQFIPN